MSRQVSETTMTNFSSVFTMVQFAAQTIFLIVVTFVSMGLELGDVGTAQTSQAINAVWIGVSFFVGWRLLPKVEARHELPAGKSLFLQGFRQNWSTIQRIYSEYRKGLFWYLFALAFAEAGANAYILVAVVYLDDALGMSASEIGLFFMVTLLAMIPGGMIGNWVTSKTNPNISWRLSMVVLFGLGTFGGLALNPDNVWPVGYIWGLLVGLDLGWYYPTENLFFSLIVPKGQEAELSGIFVYCTQIIGWLPPLVFSILVENDIDHGYGVLVVSAFVLIAVVLLSLAAPWDEIIEEVHKKVEQPGADAESS